MRIQRIAFAALPPVSRRPNVCTVDTPFGQVTLRAKMGDRYVLQCGQKTYYGHLRGVRPQSEQALADLAIASRQLIELANKQKPGWKRLQIYAGGNVVLDGKPLTPANAHALEEMRRLARVIGPSNLERRSDS